MNIPTDVRALILAASVLMTGPAFGRQAQDPMILVQHAYQLQEAGDYAASAAAYREFLKLRPNEVGAHSNLGVVLTKLGRYQEAIAEYEIAQKLLPNDPRIALNLALVLEKSGRLPEAIGTLEAVHQAAPDQKQISMLLADAYLQSGEYEQVIDLLQPVAEQSSEDLGVAYLLGTAYIREHRLDKGQILLDKILKNGDSAEARFLLGMQMFEAGDYPAAVGQFAAAAESNPNLPELQAFYGQALLTTGDADAAAAAFTRELENNANNFAANLALGQIFTVRHRYSDAEPLLKKALLLRPQSSEAMLSLGECEIGESKWSEARRTVEDTLKAAPQSIEAHQQMAAVYTHLAESEAAGRERAIAQRLQAQHAADGSSKGPKPGDLSPDFTLPGVRTSQLVSLHDFRDKSPVVLIFGSFTCPNFRSSADALKALHAKYGKKAPFLLIYIREAHAAGGWQSTRNERDGVELSAARSVKEKEDHAAMCSRSLHLPFSALVDGLDNKVEAAYDAWPSRAFVIDRDGRIRYSTRLTELDFSPPEMDTVLSRVTSSSKLY